ncbi:MAG: GtrA family protein [Pseudorhodoferax sp.]
MLIQYAKFFINGGILGVVAWGLQLLIYKGLGGSTALAYGAASVLTYIPLIVVNFLIQRAWIFDKPGVFWRFVLANLSIMVLVSLLSMLLRSAMNRMGAGNAGDHLAFLVAALLGSVPSFLLKRKWVFEAGSVRR